MLSYLQRPESNRRSQKGGGGCFHAKILIFESGKSISKDKWEKKKIKNLPVLSSLGPLAGLVQFCLSLAALARFDHHVGKLLDAWRAAYEVHNGEGLQVLGDAAGSGGGLRVHLVVQGQDLTVQRE